MDWTSWRHRWPNAAASRFIACRPHLWHVQVAGTGPVLLCLHGTGSASHCWRGLLPLLARDWTVVAPDLPGHGFTRRILRRRSSPDAMADDLVGLCRQEGWTPQALLGHSAGAVLALEMARRATPGNAPVRVVAVKAALGEFSGFAGALFPAAAKLLSLARFVPQIAARLVATRPRIEAALAATRSQIDAAGVEAYTALFPTRPISMAPSR